MSKLEGRHRYRRRWLSELVFGAEWQGGDSGGEKPGPALWTPARVLGTGTPSRKVAAIRHHDKKNLWRLQRRHRKQPTGYGTRAPKSAHRRISVPKPDQVSDVGPATEVFSGKCRRNENPGKLSRGAWQQPISTATAGSSCRGEFWSNIRANNRFQGNAVGGSAGRSPRGASSRVPNTRRS